MWTGDRWERERSPCDAAAAVGSAVGHVPDIEDGTACGASRVGEMGRRMGSCVGEGHMAAGPACRDPFSNGVVVGVMSLISLFFYVSKDVSAPGVLWELQWHSAPATDRAALRAFGNMILCWNRGVARILG